MLFLLRLEGHYKIEIRGDCLFKIAYVNGKYLTFEESNISVEDRGYQFADGIYEVIAIKKGVAIDMPQHLKRLRRSLEEIEIKNFMSDFALNAIIKEVVKRNNRQDGMLYIQVTRGISSRDHAFPKNIKPSLIIYMSKPKWAKDYEYINGVSVITVPENRWSRRDIKSICLLPNVLAKQKAVLAKVRESIFVTEEGIVTEGSSMNFHIVKAGVVYTHPASHAILGGVTRETTMEIAKKAQIKFIEQTFKLEELFGADEAFLTSTTAGVLPVVEVDSRKIADGKVGKTSARLVELYKEYEAKLIESSCKKATLAS